MRRWSIVILGSALVSCSSAPVADEAAEALGNAPEEWPMFGRDSGRSFAVQSARLNRNTVPKLAPAWFFPTSDLVSAQAVVAGGVVYVGGWDGYFYALDLATGAQRWRFAVDCQNAVLPVPPRCLAPGEDPPPGREATDGGLITSSAAVVNGRVYFGGGRTLYALDAATGALVWKHLICGNPEDPACASDQADTLRIFSSPLVHAGKVYVGVSADGQVGYRGAFLAFDAATGAEAWRHEIDPVLDGSGHPVLNAQGLPAAGLNRGCGNVWSSATLDPVHDTIAFGTADCNNGNDLPYHSGVVALDAATGRLRWAFTPHAGDPSNCDVDVGSTANYIKKGNRSYFGIGSKDGTYYLVDAVTGVQSWGTNVVFGGSAGGFYGGAAYDGKHLFSATGFGDFLACAPEDPRDIPFQESSMHAFDLQGNVLWEAELSQSFAATTIAGDVVFSTFPGTFTPAGALHGYDAKTGELLIDLALPASTNAPPTPVGNMVIVPIGNYFDGSNGGVMAFRTH